MLRTNLTIQTEKDYRIQVSTETEDSAWDAFLVATPGGHHVQTSLWAQIKASLGWGVVRLIARQGGRIVAGMQILMRNWPIVGALGYISKGPVFASDDPALVELIVNELHKLARNYNIQHLTLQPPGSGKNLVQQLTDKGFRPTSVEVAPRATLVIDLSKDIGTLLAEMSSKTRYNIRLSGRKGIKIREGARQDLDIYYQILKATGQRQNFTPFPKQYYTEMWRILEPHGFVKLFMAEFEGEVVSAQLIVPFRDTVINKLSVWTGRHGNRRPNEALQWTAIQWAKSQGYQYYDFEGIKSSAAKAILRKEPLPESQKQSVTSYKLGFGGQVSLFSGSYDYVYNPLYRWAYTEVFPKIRKRPAVKKMLKRLRTRQTLSV